MTESQFDFSGHFRPEEAPSLPPEDQSNQIDLGQGLSMEWKSALQPEDAINRVALTDVDGVSQCAAASGLGEAVLADGHRICWRAARIRILMRVRETPELHAADVSCLLASSEGLARIGLDTTTVTHALNVGQWVDLRGLFIFGAGNKPLNLLINLPKDCTVEVAALDARGIDVDRPDLLDPGSVQPLRPFAPEPTAEKDLALFQGGPALFGSSLTLRKNRLMGWIISSEPKTQVICAEAAFDADRKVPLTDRLSVAVGLDEQVDLARAAEAGSLAISLASGIPVIRFHDIEAQVTNQTQRLFYFPDYTSTNPYQALMYEKLPDVEPTAGDIDAAVIPPESKGLRK